VRRHQLHKPVSRSYTATDIGRKHWPATMGEFVAARVWMAWLSLVCLAMPLGGCSLSMPIAPLTSSDEDATGSIPSLSLERLLDAEDWRRAKAALSTALDPQGNGALVVWDNPQSGNKGSFTPVGKAYPSDAKICRAFSSRIDRKGDEQSMQGTACSDKGDDWTILEVKSSSKG
jgi:surface antigen